MKAVVFPPRHVEIGQRIRALRVKRGLRQVDLAAAARLSWRHLIRLERGEGGEPKRETLDRIADALGCERAELADDDDDPHPVTLDDFLRLEFRRIAREERANA